MSVFPGRVLGVRPDLDPPLSSVRVQNGETGVLRQVPRLFGTKTTATEGTSGTPPTTLGWAYRDDSSGTVRPDDPPDRSPLGVGSREWDPRRSRRLAVEREPVRDGTRQV